MPYYKPSRKLLKNGQISNREDFFMNKGYEYTLYITDHSELVQAFERLVASSKWFKLKRFDDTFGFVCGVTNDAYFEVARVVKKDITQADGTVKQAVSYVAYYQKWYTIGLYPGWGDELNQMLSCLELTFVKMDPLTWVREIPVKISSKPDMFSSHTLWAAEPPNRKITQEEAAEKKLEEYYLADRLNQHGLSVYGGTPVAQAQNASPNPLIEERIAKNLEYAENKRNEKPPVKLCASCGAELIPGDRFCVTCGAEVVKTYQEKMEEEKGIKRYPPMFITEIGEKANPFIFAGIDENKNIIQEPQDGSMKCIPLSGLLIDCKEKDASRYANIYTSVSNNDNYLYISDSRVAFINRKYNKNEAGSWIGLGSASAFVVSEILNYSGKAIKAAQRRDKAFVGHIRYEWLGLIGFRRRQKFLESDDIRFCYMDQERTKWMVRVELRDGNDCERLANEIIRRAATYRATLNKERSEEEEQFIKQYTDIHNKIPLEKEPGRVSSEILPGNCVASKGSFMRL